VRQFSVSAQHVRERFAEVEAKVAAAAKAAGRRPEDVEILVATKYVSVDDLGQLADAGIRLVGENRAQDLAAKHKRWGDRFTFDFIGHLQSRKTRTVLPLVRLIHSVSSLSVVQEIQARAQNPVQVLLEVNIGGEDSKSGVEVAAVESFLSAAAECDKVVFCGLMCMPPLYGDPQQAAPEFGRTRELAARLSSLWTGRYTFDELSMGTSADYEVAVREGATIVRVGSILF
jgi:PLP dependent protein